MGIVTEVAGPDYVRVRPDAAPAHATDWLRVPKHIKEIKPNDRVSFDDADVGNGSIVGVYEEGI